VLYCHPSTTASLYVGNATAAKSLDILGSLSTCRRIVFCQDGDGSRHHEGNPEFKYLTFPIGRWRSHVSRKPDEVLAFFRPLFEFLEEVRLDEE